MDKKEDIDFGSNVFFGKLDPLGSAKTGSKEENSQEINTKESNIEDEVVEKVNSLSEDTVRKLQEEDLPPLPANYQLYFERLLEQEDASVKQKVQNVMDLQNISEDRAIFFEKSVKEGFKNVKQLLDFIAILYKNLQVIPNLTEKHIKEFEKIDNKMALTNALTIFSKDIQKINGVTSNQLSQIKDLYQKTAKSINEINQNTIYDSRFNIYNRRYFVTLIEKETKLMEEFNHISSILTMSLSVKIRNRVQDKNIMMILLKSIAKLLLKTSRRSDIIGYLGDGIFGIGLKYSDIESAKRAAERFVSSIKTTNIFLGDRDILLDVSVGVAKISTDLNSEESIKKSLSALKIALEEEVDYKVCVEDEV